VIAESGKNSKRRENRTDGFADLHMMPQNINERVFDLFYQAHKFSKTYTPD
jgi:hypothetical protein